VINQFQPDRILSLHAMHGTATELRGGVFADPNSAKLPGGAQAVDLARGMARLIPSDANRPSNKLTDTTFDPVYPGDRAGVVSGGTSLGAYGPTGVPGKTDVPVITMEAPEFAPLGKGARNVEQFLRPVRGFLTDPAQLDARADEDIVRDIAAFSLDERREFLTGRRPSTDEIFQRIQRRIDTAVARLNAMKPPVAIRVVSRLRPFTEQVDGRQSQMDIVFAKFFLTGNTAARWDTLPDKYFTGGARAKGINRTDHKAPNWFDETAAARFATILQFSSLPGVSRHHWDTDVDFNSVIPTEWNPPNDLAKLDIWLQANAASAGFVQAFTAGRSGGYSEEKWHYSYAPIAIALRTMWNRDVRAKEDVFDRLAKEFQHRATKAGLSLPADFDAALRAISIADFMNKIGSGL
jgi:D-alanyl-D-alanine carboxypeptidase